MPSKKNTKVVEIEEDANSINSEEETPSNVIKNVDFASFIKKTFEKEKKKSDESGNPDEDDDDDDDDDDDVDGEDEDGEDEDGEDGEDGEDEDGEDEDGEEEDGEDDIKNMIEDMSLYHILSNFLVDDEGNNIATSLSNIAVELHKLNKNIKSFRK
jgi:hypothetical protein